MGVVSGAVRRSLLLGVAGVTLLLASCGGAHDQAGGLTKEDYEALKARRPAADARPVEEPPIPALQPILAAPQPPSLADSRRVTIQATEPTPVRDLLIEIARKADLDLELDPRIEGGVIITARDRPIKDVVERIADLAALRYEFADNRLRVELDEPYLESYRVDVLAQRRQTETEIASSTDVFSSVGQTTTTGSNLSSVSVTTTADADVWAEISSNLETIISQAGGVPRTVSVTGQARSSAAEAASGGTGGTNATSGGTDAGAAPTAANPASAAVSGSSTSSAGTGAPGASPQPGDTQIQAALAAGATGSQSTAGNGQASSASAESESEDNGHYFIVNRQAGIVSVYTTGRQHVRIRKYLESVQRNSQAQVLIEAKIVEVTLKDEYRAGIDWRAALTTNYGVLGASSLLSGRGLNELGNIVAPETISPVSTISGRGSVGDVNFEGVIDLVDEFGTARTLSNPRLTVLNNQNAVLKVAENEVYFTIRVEREQNDDGPDTVTYQSELRTVPVGLVLTVQPSINLDSREVAMSLRPTVSRIVDRVSDPGVELQAATVNATVRSLVPVVEVREMDSMVTLHSGDVLVLGGLMQERTANRDYGTPGLKDVPLLGMPFRREQKDTQVVELVIFLRATIVNGRDSVHPADVELYNKFTPDPRPIAF
ncbi:pilus (MSHA type) biogenesis protein MshL [Caenispirillum bisanense]|uniref:General secretion pathway protein D n=1 Tax=Caenispirillum bisanense TaxID=414052 RepID=A0A286GWX2_9PROT|nr:pilus (MSHA type) biogenesis protein MshL [Caenispirillum bisanense]SOE00030.1 general secretion pathway protein D [Caenispirillum bisanense]